MTEKQRLRTSLNAWCKRYNFHSLPALGPFLSLPFWDPSLLCAWLMLLLFSKQMNVVHGIQWHTLSLPKFWKTLCRHTVLHTAHIHTRTHVWIQRHLRNIDKLRLIKVNRVSLDAVFLFGNLSKNRLFLLLIAITGEWLRLSICNVIPSIYLPLSTLPLYSFLRFSVKSLKCPTYFFFAPPNLN